MKSLFENIPSRFRSAVKPFALVVLSIAILSSCTERIDIQTDEEFQKLAVEGYITPSKQSIRLTETSGYFSQEAPAPVRNALVVVSMDDGEYQFSEDAENPGYYLPPEDFEVKAEATYKLDIDLQEAIGGESSFESEATMPVLVDEVDSINVFYRSDFESWIVQLYAYEPPGPNFYAFSAFVNNKPITDSLSRIGAVDDRIVDGTYLNGIWVLFLRENEVAVGDTVSLATISISEDYYRFLSEAQTELSPNNPLFSGPPANVMSNISNGALGYFAVYSSVMTSTIITEKEE
jgi:hypothetical protein